MEKQINLELSDIQRIDFEEYNDDEFSVARMTFLGSNPNSHRLLISEDVLRKSSNTVLGKWLVAKMNYVGTDMEGHEPTEHIMGIVPKDQTVEFIRDEEGFLRAYVDVVISKIYARDFYEVMKQDGQHSVSVEMMVDSDDYNGIGEIVHAFNILGITCLGRTVAPSCAGANIELVRFAQEAETFFKEKDNTSKATTNKTKEVMSNDTNVKRKEGDATMAENKKKETVELEEEKFADPESEKEEEKLEESTEEFTEDDKEEKLEESTEELAQDKSSELEEKTEKDKEEPSEEELSVEELKKQLEEKENIIMEKDAELAELKDFKEAKECAERDELVSQTLATVKQAFSEKDYNKLEAEGRACTLSEVTGWQNKVKAMAFDGLTNNKEFKFEQAEVNTFGGDEYKEKIQKTSSGLWIK